MTKPKDRLISVQLRPEMKEWLENLDDYATLSEAVRTALREWRRSYEDRKDNRLKERIENSHKEEKEK